MNHTSTVVFYIWTRERYFSVQTCHLSIFRFIWNLFPTPCQCYIKIRAGEHFVYCFLFLWYFQSINICATSAQHHFDFDCYMIDWIPKTVWEPIMTHIVWFMLRICYITFIGRHMRVIKCISKRHELLAPHKLPLFSCPRKTGIK